MAVLFFLVFAVLLALAYRRYTYISEKEILPVKDVLLQPEQLENHARQLGREHIVTRRVRYPKSLLARLDKNFEVISSVYKSINGFARKKRDLSPASEWLLDNYYKIEEQVKEIRQNLTREKILQLNILDNGILKGYPRAYAIALELISHTDGRLDQSLLIRFIKAYQAQSKLTIAEVWSLSLMIRLALIENIRGICEKIYRTQLEWEKAEELVANNKDDLLEALEVQIDEMGGLSPSYVEHLLRKLRKEGMETGEITDFIDRRLFEMDKTIKAIVEQEHQEQAARKISIGNSITSLNIVSVLDWNDIFESLCAVHEILREDPVNVYPRMDFETRDYYRHQVEQIAKKLGISQTNVARKAVECAARAYSQKKDSRAGHVGYYIVGRGRKELFARLGRANVRDNFHNYSIYTYLSPVLLVTGLIVLAFIIYAYEASEVGNAFVSILAGLIVLIPSSDISVSLVNWIFTHRIPPGFLPKIEFREGIPEDCTTLVVIPTLLPNANRVKELLEQLEVYYLANREDNLYFAIAGDFKDAENEKIPGDQEIIDTALEGIKGLNQKYSTDKDIFFFFHRHRQFCGQQDKWMGWERKRGALLELNDLLSGSADTSYSTVSSDISHLRKVRYVITLDADTNIPMDTAKKLIGTISHPLNRAVYDEDKGIVVDGYGVIQPRIGINVENANSTIFTRVFAGQGGIDPYTTAISDVYQDLFSEGIFTGKGVYDIQVFNRVLKDAFPDNSVLSHDLLEGSYVRAALATDIELIDGYPSRYSSYMMRLHRWVRGDWQLIKWLASRVKNRRGEVVKNPLSTLSKWKIIDNLRRSLVSISLVLLIILGLTILPGDPLAWLGLAVVSTGFQMVLAFADLIWEKYYKTVKDRLNGNLIYGVKSSLFQSLLVLAFLPYHAYMMGDAIIRTLYRVFISGKNLLEWVTAAEAEKNLKNDLKSYLVRMRSAAFISLLVLLLVGFVKPQNLPYAVFFAALWGASPAIAYRISSDVKDEEDALTGEEVDELRRIARKTWAYYEDFAGPENNYLPPDNFQVNPPNGVAHRTSPTNIGFLLLSILSARDFGYISTIDMLERIEKTISTMERMETWKGHLYNWYDTRTLEVLRPFFVSTVDSGNLVGYLITLKQGLMGYKTKPVIGRELAQGLKDVGGLAKIEDEKVWSAVEALSQRENIRLSDWTDLIGFLSGYEFKNSKWGKKLEKAVASFKDEIEKVFIDKRMATGSAEKPGGGELVKDLVSIMEGMEKNNSLEQLRDVYGELLKRIDKALKLSTDNMNVRSHLVNLRAEILKVKSNVDSLILRIDDLAGRIERLVDATDFRPLYDGARHLFSIGYNVEEEKMVNSYYDLLASEARLTSYMAIVRREVPKKHWFKLGRALSMLNGYRGLVSWAGTMFEYFMPLLVMKNFKNTLLDETYNTIVRAQKTYGQKRNVPWGTSESGYYAFDMMLNYQYKAFGLPDFGLKRGLANDMVVSPYSSLLALPVSPKDVLDNLKVLKSEGLEGEYGFYEAVDYTPGRLPRGKKKGIVESYMAHHQGMTFIVLNNFLNQNIIQKRFHSDPVIRAGEILLQEKIPLKVIITKEYKERIEPLEDIEREDVKVVRIYGVPDSAFPHCHMLSNGRYSILITNGGIGFSKKEDIFLTRWREDAIGGKYGTFIFLRNLNSNDVWSATYEPIREHPDGYMAIFTQDKAEFYRTDDNIETHSEIVVTTEDNAEVRRITLTNHGNYPVVIELTSYFETVIAPHTSDVAHPAFNNLFVRTELLQQYDSLIASRRPREQDRNTMWAVHAVAVEGEIIGNLQYETNRGNFIGRGRNISNPAALTQPLSNTTGIVLDPVMSLRRRVKIEPGNSVKVSFVSGIADSREEAVELAKKYYSPASIARAFELAYTRSQVEASYLNLKAGEIKTFQNMMPHIVFLSSIRRKYGEILKKNVKGQRGLWPYGISGDIPIVLVAISKADDIDLVRDCLKAHEYWRTKGLKVDLVILNEDESSYLQPLQELLNEVVLASHGRDIHDRPGGVFIRNANVMPKEDRALLYSAARIILKGDGGPIDYQLKQMEGEVLPKVKSFNRYNISYQSEDIPLDLTFFNGYGGFSKDGKEYVIKLKGYTNTPSPWINVVSNGKFGFHVSESGSGLTWAENSRENKLTPWSNDPVSDTPGEVVYLRDDDNGDIWTVTPLPIREVEGYVVKHGLGYSEFNHDSHGIEQKLVMFVPREDPVKIGLLKLKNHSNGRRKLSITYYVRPVLGVSEGETQQHILTEKGENNKTILIRNPFNSDFPGRIAFVDTSGELMSYTGDREEFIGRDGDLSQPEALKRESLSNRIGIGYNPCVAIQTFIELEADEERGIVFLLGHAKEKYDVYRIADEYRNIARCEEALEDVKEYWNKTLGAVRVKTPDPSMDLMLNYWLLYQTISCRLWARSAFYQSGGAYGFRDQLQDAMNSVYVVPEVAREQILLHCAHQFVEGDVQHWWHPGAEDKGIRTKFSDDLLWLPFATAEYINKTEDYDILKEEVHFLESEPLGEDEDERYGIPRVSEERASVYNHCIRAIERSLKFGEHGIPLMGSGDWNDGMNTVGNKGKGESIWLGWFLCATLTKFIPICRRMNDLERAQRYIEEVERIVKAIEENGWDGGWYRRAYFDDGTPLGSAENTECTIDSIAQSWAVISKLGNDGRIKEAMSAVENYLVRRDEGLILLFTPPFDESDLNPGYIKGYVPGVRENGGQYTHAATWVVNAFAMMGDGDKAWELYNMINPINHTRTPIECATYKVEPYVIAADVYAVRPHVGRGGWTWYTGAAGWMYKVGIEYILGFKKNGDRLVIDPCIPKEWDEYNITYRYKNTTYNIAVKNPAGVCKGVGQIVVDGKPVESDFIKLEDDGKEHMVEVFMNLQGSG
jgi:cellobiose phosphorylase